MECLTANETINKTFELVKNTSYSEKKSAAPTQAEIDSFLDNILLLQQDLNIRSEKIEFINERLEELTWLNNIEEDALKQINNLIGSAKDLHSILIRQFVNLNSVRKNGIAKEANRRFKHSIDNLKELTADLDSVFFALPAMAGFKETTKELSLI